MDRKIMHNKFDKQFELHLDNGLKAFISYTKNENHLSLTHSEVPLELRGKGIGKELVEKTFEAINKEGLTATAYCSYIRAVAKRSDKWQNFINR